MYNDLKMESLFILEWPKLFTEDWQLDGCLSVFKTLIIPQQSLHL